MVVHHHEDDGYGIQLLFTLLINQSIFGGHSVKRWEGFRSILGTFARKWAVGHSPRLPYSGLCGAPRAAVARSHKPEMYRSIVPEVAADLDGLF